MFLVINLKKAITCICIILLSVSVVFAAVKSEKGIELPVIMYHSILDSEKYAGKYVISSSELEEDLKYLKENGYVAVTVKDLYDYVYSGKALPKKPVMLTFDDGYYNNYVNALPLMKKYNMKMVMSVVGSYSDNAEAENDENVYYSYVTWDRIREMSASGLCEIQNHSYNFHSYDDGRMGSKKMKGESDSEYKKLFSEDTLKNSEKIQTVTGEKPLCYTYPFGGVSNASFDILKEIGVKASLSCGEGMNYITRDTESLYMLKRFLRPDNKSVEEILR